MEHNVGNDLHNSDHFPPIINVKFPNTSHDPPKQTKFPLDIVDWINYSKLAEEVLKDTSYFSDTHPIDKCATFLGKFASALEVESCLNNAKGKTPGLNHVSYQMVKALLNLGKMYTTQSFPPAIQKNKNSSFASNNRPILLLSWLPKILKKSVVSTLIWSLQSKNVFMKHQVEFKPRRSLIDAILPINYFATKAISERTRTTIVSIDLKKVFGRVGLHVTTKSNISSDSGCSQLDSKILLYGKCNSPRISSIH